MVEFNNQLNADADWERLRKHDTSVDVTFDRISKLTKRVELLEDIVKSLKTRYN